MPRKKAVIEPKTRVRHPVIQRVSAIQINYVLYTLLLIAAFALGYLFSRVQTLEGGSGLPFGLGGSNNGGTQGTPQVGGVVEVDEGDLPPLGKGNAKVTIVEFSDLQCPFCRTFYEAAYKDIKKEYIDSGKVAFYYRHYPLSFHPMAQPSALAAECANEQDKFWQFHDKVYEEQAKQGQGTIQYTNDDLKKWAADLKLDMNKFNSCLDSEKHKGKVDKDFADGGSAGVDGTPTFFINGNRLVGAQPFSAFKTLIDQELNK